MSFLKNLKTDPSLATETDSLGGGFQALDSGVYDATITLAYIETAKSEATGVNLTMKTADDKEIKQVIWLTSGKAKGGTTYYKDKDGKNQPLPGYLLGNSLALLTVGTDISEVETEEKIVKVYSYEAKAEVPTKVQVLTALIGQPITVALMKVLEDKTKKNDATNVYEATGETREVNDIKKFFHTESRKTTSEIRENTDAAFITAWGDKHTGKVENKVGKAPKGTGATAFGVAKSAASAPKASSLFGAPKAAPAEPAE